jgi:hypothetical protein
MVDWQSGIFQFCWCLQFIGQLRLESQEALKAKDPQPPSPQLIKVALRA